MPAAQTSPHGRPFRLMALPFEVRTQVYRYILWGMLEQGLVIKSAIRICVHDNGRTPVPSSALDGSSESASSSLVYWTPTISHPNRLYSLEANNLPILAVARDVRDEALLCIMFDFPPVISKCGPSDGVCNVALLKNDHWVPVVGSRHLGTFRNVTLRPLEINGIVDDEDPGLIDKPAWNAYWAVVERMAPRQVEISCMEDQSLDAAFSIVYGLLRQCRYLQSVTLKSTDAVEDTESGNGKARWIRRREDYIDRLARRKALLRPNVSLWCALTKTVTLEFHIGSVSSDERLRLLDRELPWPV